MTIIWLDEGGGWLLRQGLAATFSGVNSWAAVMFAMDAGKYRRDGSKVSTGAARQRCATSSDADRLPDLALLAGLSHAHIGFT